MARPAKIPIMPISPRIVPFFLILGALSNAASFVSQDKPAVCKKSVLAAWKPIPALRYSCKGAKDEWDEKILKLPARLNALKAITSQLETFTQAAWWQADVEDLSVCDFQRKAGTLSATERERFNTTYVIKLLGNDHLRLVLLPDPCYQTEYSGSVGLLLNRKNGRVFTSKVLDGFFTRADNAVNMDFAKLNQEEIIEVSTGSGGLHPEITNYYFTIDPRTNRAVPMKLFAGDNGPTNEINSALLMSDPEDFNLPGEAVTLKVISDGKLAKSFSIYAEDDSGEIDDNGRKLKRTVLKWDGKLYR